MGSAWSEEWLSRIEDAGLNATAPPQQRWMDGWLLRFSPGKAKRARCINPVAPGRQPWSEKLRQAIAFYDELGMELAVRITPFTQPPELDAALDSAGYRAMGHTQVMVCADLMANRAQANSAPASWCVGHLEPAAFADAVGELRGSPTAQRSAHAERLLCAPVPSERLIIRAAGANEADADSRTNVLACGQATREGEFVGLYDIHTREKARGAGLAGWLCEHLLSNAARHGSKSGYLQVEEGNDAARRIYRRMGFVDAYTYHYRQIN